MIQLYAHIDDLIPTEPRDRVFDEGTMQDRIDEHRQSIKEGWKWSKRVNPDGTLSKGNATYYICRDLGIEWIPVDMAWFTGCIKHNQQLWLRPNFVINLDSFHFKREIEVHDRRDWDFATNPPVVITQLHTYKLQGTQAIPNINGLLYKERK